MAYISVTFLGLFDPSSIENSRKCKRRLKVFLNGYPSRSTHEYIFDHLELANQCCLYQTAALRYFVKTFFVNVLISCYAKNSRNVLESICLSALVMLSNILKSLLTSANSDDVLDQTAKCWSTLCLRILLNYDYIKNSKPCHEKLLLLLSCQNRPRKTK